MTQKMGSGSSPYELILESRGDYLYARVTAEKIDPRSATEYLQRIAAACSKENIGKVLIDRRIPMMMSDADNYLLILDMTRFLGHKKIAFVNPFDEINAKMDLSEVMSRNRNAPYRVFKTEEAAVRWLEDDDSIDHDLHSSDA